MDANFLKNIIGHISSVPPLPAAAQKLIQLTSNINVNIKEVGQVVSMDLGIASKLLQIVNSPFYGLRQKINTVPQAITLIGLEAVRSLALSLSVIKTGKDEKSPLYLTQEDFWRHSLSTAIISKKVSPLISSCEPEEAFVAGLMHDMGKLILLEFTKDNYNLALMQASKAQVPLTSLEHEMFELDHAILADELCRHWKIPDTISKAIAYHHEPLITNETPPEYALAKVVSVGNQLAHLMDLGKSGNFLMSMEVIQYLIQKKVDFENMKNIVKAVTKGVEDAAKLFGFRETKAAETVILPVACYLSNPEDKALFQLILAAKNYPFIDLSTQAVSTLTAETIKAVIHDNNLPEPDKEFLKQTSIPCLNYDAWKQEHLSPKNMFPVSYLHVWLTNPV